MILLREFGNTVMTGWPFDRSGYPYWNFRDEVGIQDGVLLKGNKIIVSTSLQPDILQQLHVSHHRKSNTHITSRLTHLQTPTQCSHTSRSHFLCRQYQIHVFTNPLQASLVVTTVISLNRSAKSTNSRFYQIYPHSK